MSEAAAPESTGGLRARRRAQTEREVEEAALAAFARDGFDSTTMEQIAASAGVSVRTAFRYFPTKVDTVLFSARRVYELVGAGLLADIDHGTTLAGIEDSIAGSLAALVDSDPELVARLKRVRELMLGDERLRAEVAKSEGFLAGLDAHDPAAVGLEKRLVAGVAAATLRSAFDHWAGTTGDGATLVEQYRRARSVRDSVVAPGR